LILADTAIWVDHLHHGDDRMAALLDAGYVVMHPYIIGEIALGNLRNRAGILDRLRLLPMTTAATDEEVLGFIERHRLFGAGVGYVDVHLLASTLLTAGARLWTRDRRLKEAAERLDIAAEPAG
jgi:predicted nucleic acid-binding protein